MPEFSDLTLLPFCAGLTLLGLIGSWLAWRRRGATAGMRGVALALLPAALYLTGLLELVWDVVKAFSDWFLHLVFSPAVWAGTGLFAISIVLFVLTGVLRSSGPETKPAPDARGELTPTGGPSAAARPSKPAAGKTSEFDEVEDILKRHGID